MSIRSAIPGSLPLLRIPLGLQRIQHILHSISSALQSLQRPKVLTGEAVQASDVVITMGCGDACPVFPGKRYLDWDLPDPAGQPIEAVRPIRDEIGRRVRALVAELTQATT